MKVEIVSHMDQVLRHALKVKDPQTLLDQPSEAVDWRMAKDPSDPRVALVGVVLLPVQADAGGPGGVCCPANQLGVQQSPKAGLTRELRS